MRKSPDYLSFTPLLAVDAVVSSWTNRHLPDARTMAACQYIKDNRSVIDRLVTGIDRQIINTVIDNLIQLEILQ
jgi:hypothetical protein